MYGLVPEKKFREVSKKPKEDRQIAIRKAQIRDVEEILELANVFALGLEQN